MYDSPNGEQLRIQLKAWGWVAPQRPRLSFKNVAGKMGLDGNFKTLRLASIAIL